MSEMAERHSVSPLIPVPRACREKLRGELKDNSFTLISAAATVRSTVEIASFVNDQAANRLLSRFTVEEVEHTKAPASVRVRGQFEDRATPKLLKTV